MGVADCGLDWGLRVSEFGLGDWAATEVTEGAGFRVQGSGFGKQENREPETGNRDRGSGRRGLRR
jgi:hypothetical protein